MDKLVNAIVGALIGVLAAIGLMIAATLAVSFYHEVILQDTYCGAIGGHPTEPKTYCGGRPYP